MAGLRVSIRRGISMLRCVMLSSDVIDLRDFYRSGLGQVARRMIRRAIQRVWPDLHGLRVLGFGYTTPFLTAIAPETERTVALMPAALGVLGWPSEGPNRVTLADEGELPFADYSIDRVLIVHAVETSEQIRPMLKEIWRVLAGGGRLLIVVPNRRGIWARLDRTPFGSGRPYTMSQLSQLLRDELFTPIGSDTALFIPPLRKRMILRSAPAWERIGKRWFPTFAGVVLIEATKQIYAKPAIARMPRRRLIYTPAPHGLSRSGAAGGSQTCGPGAWATAFVSRRFSDSTNTLCSASKFARLPWGSRE